MQIDIAVFAISWVLPAHANESKPLYRAFFVPSTKTFPLSLSSASLAFEYIKLFSFLWEGDSKVLLMAIDLPLDGLLWGVLEILSCALTVENTTEVKAISVHIVSEISACC